MRVSDIGERELKCPRCQYKLGLINFEYYCLNCKFSINIRALIRADGDIMEFLEAESKKDSWPPAWTKW